MTVVHYPFNPDQARAAAAVVAYPREGRADWQPHVRTPPPPTPIVPPRFTTAQVRAAVGDGGHDLPVWEPHANCLGMNAALFFPERGDMASIKQAKSVSAGCPVRIQCLTAALNRGEKHGIFGGRSEEQRRELRRRLTHHIEAA